MELTQTVDTDPTKLEPSDVIRLPGTAASRTLVPDQLRLLLQVHLDLEPARLGGDLASQLVERVAGVLAAKAAIAVRYGGGAWVAHAESDAHPAIGSLASAGHLLDRVAAAPFGARTERCHSCL